MRPLRVAQERLWPERRLQIQRQRRIVVDIGMLEWIEPLPKGHEWIEAYFAWRDLIELSQKRMIRNARQDRG